jgi:hypothetical protein
MTDYKYLEPLDLAIEMLVLRENEEQNIDIKAGKIFTSIDTYCDDGRFDKVDYFLSLVNTRNLAHELSFSILVMTRAPKQYLKNRVAFFNATKEYYEETIPDRSENLLRNMK